MSKECHWAITLLVKLDETAEDVETQIAEKLRSRKSSMLKAYVKHSDNGEFPEEMLCEALKTSNTVIDMYNKLKKLFRWSSNINAEYYTSGTDVQDVMMGKKHGCLKLTKDDNLETLLVHCAIHRADLVYKILSPDLNDILNTIIKYINTIKTNAKCEHLFKQFW